MNEYVAKLLTHIPAGYETAANNVAALALSGSGSLVIEHDQLYVTSDSTQLATTIDLHGRAVRDIVSLMPAGISATVLADGMAELLGVSGGYASTVLPATLEIPSNALWYLIGMMSRTLESRRRSMLINVLQINLPSSTGMFLDWWGATLGVERLVGEPDGLYAGRITMLRFRPNVNNVAMETIFRALGYETSVTDSTPGTFNVSVQLPSAAPNGFYYTIDQIQSTLALIKASGTNATVVLSGALQDDIGISDSLSQSTNAAAWTWGNFTWGQFNWVGVAG